MIYVRIVKRHISLQDQTTEKETIKMICCEILDFYIWKVICLTRSKRYP